MKSRLWILSALGTLSLSAIVGRAEAQGVVRVYDGANRLVRETIDGQVVSYKYDGEGNLAVRCLGAACTDVIVSPDREVLGEEGAVNRVYANGPSGTVANRSGVEAPRYPLVDSLGSVVGQVGATGTVAARRAFSAYGDVRTSTDTSSLGYAGEYQDSSSRSVWLRARTYSPEVGRFVERDSFEGFADTGQSLNRFSYVHNNPLTSIDPTGHFTTDQNATIVGGYAYGVDVGGMAAPGPGGGLELQRGDNGVFVLRVSAGVGRNREGYAGRGSLAGTGVELSVGGGVNPNVLGIPLPNGNAGLGGGGRVAVGLNVERAMEKGAVTSGTYGSGSVGWGFGGLNSADTHVMYLDGSYVKSKRLTASSDRNGFGLIQSVNKALKGYAPGKAPQWYGDARLTATIRLDFLTVPYNMLDDDYIRLMEAHRNREDVDRRYLAAVRARKAQRDRERMCR